MRLAEKLLSRAAEAGAGSAPGASIAGAAAPRHDRAGPPRGALSGGVLTFGDVASAREEAADPAATAPRWSAGAIKRVGSVKFAAKARSGGARAGSTSTESPRGANSGRGATGARRGADDASAAASLANEPPPPPRGRPRSRLPADWTLKTRLKFTSDRSLAWVARRADPRPSDAGVRAFCAGDDDDASALETSLGDDALGVDEGVGVSSRKTIARLSARLQRALCTYAYPADPLDPELVRSMRRTDAGAAWLERRWDDWRDALVSAYASLRLGKCDAFYVVYDDRVVLFCAPGVAESVDGFAVVTDAAEGKFADAMASAAVRFERVGADKASRGVFEGNENGSLRANRAATRGREHASKFPLERWATEDPYDDPSAFLGDSEALDDRGKPIARSPRKKLGARDRDPAAGCAIVRGAANVHGLLNVMLEAPHGDPAGAASSPKDAPTVLSPTPFARATLRPLALRVTKSKAAAARKNDEQTKTAAGEGAAATAAAATRWVHAVECATNHAGLTGDAGSSCRGVIPPWCVSRVLEALCDAQEENILASFRTLGVSARLNHAAKRASEGGGEERAAARGEEARGGEEGGEEGKGVRGAEGEERARGEEGALGASGSGGRCSYYSEEERLRVREDAALAGGRGLEKVERRDGTYYLQSLYDDPR